MSRQNINIGSNVNDGTGDPLRTAFDKINNNFIELYGTSLTERVSLDTSPQLGGDLDVVTHSIVSTTNRDIVLAPHGTGAVKAGALKFSGTSISSDDSTIININEGLNVSGATSLSTSLALATGATVTGILDEDNMATNSATQLATQQSIKAYVDSQVTAQDLDFAGDSGGTQNVDLDSQSLTIAGGTGIDSVGSAQTVTLNIDATVATLSGSQTLTNKVITSPTINGATMTGNVTVDNITLNDNIISSSSNADLILDPSGTGDIKLTATSTDVTGNASVSGTLTTADITTTGNQTISGSLTAGSFNVGDLNIDASGKFTTDTNGNIDFNPSGSGVVVISSDVTHTGTQNTTGQLNVDNIRIDGNVISSTSGSITLSPAAGTNLVLGATGGGVVTASELQATLGEFTTLRADTIQNDTSDGDISINTQGTGNINVNSLKITNLQDPSSGQDAATKAYVDSQGPGGGTVTASSTTTLTNKTFDAEGTGNSLSNVDVANLKSGVLDTDISSVAGTDTTLASAKAIKTYVDAQVAGKDNTDEITEGSSNLYFTNARADARITNALKDEDNMASDSATHVPSQQSVKAYVDAGDLSLIDEDNFATNSATRPPSQQSVKAYVDAQTLSLIDEDNFSTDSATRPPSQQSVKAYVATQIATKDNTDEITEGSTNLYFTNARADARITNALIDEDNMASNSATKLPSQQSVKAYVDANSGSAEIGDITFVGSTIISPSNADITLDPAGTGLVRMNTDNIALGSSAGTTSQGAESVAIGKQAGTTSQGDGSVAIGAQAGTTSQGAESVAIGDDAGTSSQGQRAVAIGRDAGNDTQGEYAVAVGSEAGEVTQGAGSVAIGGQAGYNTGDNAVHIGRFAGGGINGVGAGSIGIGKSAGVTSQSSYAIAIGYEAGVTSQGTNSIAIGKLAGNNDLTDDSIAIGTEAGKENSGSSYTTTIGYQAGYTGTGTADRSLALGFKAGYSRLDANCIVLNAHNGELNTVASSRFYVKPVRSQSGNSQPLLRYDATSGEISYMPHIEINDNQIAAVQSNTDLILTGNGTGATKINGKLVINASQADGSSTAIDTTKSVAVLAGNSGTDDNEYTLADGTTAGQIIYLVRGPNSNRESIHVTFSKFENDGTTASNTRKEIFSQFMSVVPCIWNGTAWCVGQHQN